MKIEPALITVRDAIFHHVFSAELNDTGVITGPATWIALSDVIDNTYQTLFSQNYTVEDVGLIEVLTIDIFTRNNVNGDGSYRWQISGDGGSAWVTMVEVSFNVVSLTGMSRNGIGRWVSSIDTGTSKLRVRLQALANSGTVNMQVRNTSEISVQYRQKVRP